MVPFSSERGMRFISTTIRDSTHRQGCPLLTTHSKPRSWACCAAARRRRCPNTCHDMLPVKSSSKNSTSKGYVEALAFMLCIESEHRHQHKIRWPAAPLILSFPAGAHQDIRRAVLVGSWSLQWHQYAQTEAHNQDLPDLNRATLCPLAFLLC